MYPGKAIQLCSLFVLLQACLACSGADRKAENSSSAAAARSSANQSLKVNEDGTIEAEAAVDPDAGKMRVGFSNFKGRAQCFSCHAEYVVEDRQTAHDLALSEMDGTFVKGDFANTPYNDELGTALFYRQGSSYMVRSTAPDGSEGDYEIAWCLGGQDLQQYVLKMDKGRYQVLDIAWDLRPALDGGQRFVRISAGGPHGQPGENNWLGLAANWNTQCVSCHSSDVEINYDAATGGFATLFREDDVTCEACHGGGNPHIGWAQNQQTGEETKLARKGLIFLLGDGAASWEMDSASGTARRKPPLSGHKEVETCMQCHARYDWLYHGYRHDRDPYNFLDLALLTEGLYEADGQPGDVQVFETGSFLQSSEYRKGVSCSDCHDSHTGRPLADGNELCLRCHEGTKFNVSEHHHHPAGSSGASCINCHMPAHEYPAGELRHDHSLRIPRPDLTASIGTPNACSSCHTELGLSAVQSAWDGWYGSEHAAHYGTAFARSRQGDPRSLPELERLATDYSLAPIVRATAFHELGNFASPTSLDVIGKGLQESESIVRLAAVRACEGYEPQIRTDLLSPLMQDKLQAVQMEVGRLLAGLSTEGMSEDGQQVFARCIDRYIASQGDKPWLASSHVNMGWMYGMRGMQTEADEAFAEAARLDPRNVDLYLRRAQVVLQSGNESAVEDILQQGLKQLPGNTLLRNALGNDYMRRDMQTEALAVFKQAYEADPANADAAYGYAGVLAMESRHGEARRVLEDAIKRHPWNQVLLLSLHAELLLLDDSAAADEVAGRLNQYYPWMQVPAAHVPAEDNVPGTGTTP